MFPQYNPDCINPPIIWVQGDTLYQQYNIFYTLSYSFEDTNACLLTTRTSEGPFYLPDSIVRKDIRGNQPGAELHLIIKVVDVKGCRPVPNAVIDIWQANAFGVYSGYEGVSLPQLGGFEKISHAEPVNKETFLRGRQYSDKNGFAEFYTIYPGWYQHRTAHIHLKIFIGSKEFLTTQLFFPQILNYKVHSLPPYNARPIGPYTNENDIVLRDSHGVEGGWPKITELGCSYTATLTIGVLFD